MSDTQVFGLFIDLEAEARAAVSEEALIFHIINGTRRLVACRQALAVALGPDHRPEVKAAANVAVVDRRSPFLQWFETGLSHLARDGGLHRTRIVAGGDFPPETAGAWHDWCPSQALWIPLKGAEETLLGGLWLARDEPWQEAEQALLSRLGGCYGHAWEALALRSGRRSGGRPRRHVIGGALLAAAILVLAVPVRQSVLAPAEVVAEVPHVVVAPLDGVIRSVFVRPNQPVAQGEALFAMDDTSLRAEAELARRALDLARAELDKARQGAFLDARSKAEVDVLGERVRLRKAEVSYADERLARITVRTEVAGVAIFSSDQDWIGKPVRTGERVMTVAAPEKAALRIDLAAEDAIDLPQGAGISLFLGTAPLSPVAAELVRISYEARPLPNGTMAFRLDGRFVDADRPRIGLRGTAKVHGRPVPLILFLFRRPLGALRQLLGV
ncbi:MAG: hypothetical protein H7841_08985 [Magnetospirillum sp. WYHS-4]